MTCKELKQIELITIMNYIGFIPRISNNQAWYKNPFNGGNEKVASFKIDLRKNIWYAHNLGIGGNNIDFLSHYLKTTNISNILKWADERKNNFFFQQQYNSYVPDIKEGSSKGEMLVYREFELNHPKLIKYIASRKIDLNIAKYFCREILYMYDGRSKFYSIGFKNDSGGYELRNSISKNCMIKKDITTHTAGSEEVLLFEGFFDLLSWYTIHCPSDQIIPLDYCVLNSTINLDRTIPFLSDYSAIRSYLHLDSTGRLAHSKLKNWFSDSEKIIIDEMDLIKKNHPDFLGKDLNDFLIYT
ncbi:toprim domain-containing protein [Sphingobacterium faecium]|uniref:toprim domain-containing protein n=1 Tax=Sphingobacterium faecium TaxID=34087 RepID=UPI0021B4E498|nr:toprim domain-containing protein [Sphingobacterium faecium]UXD70025.1 toprim domain-containing protein [Sphingobacterium faecium]